MNLKKIISLPNITSPKGREEYSIAQESWVRELRPILGQLVSLDWAGKKEILAELGNSDNVAEIHLLRHLSCLNVNKMGFSADSEGWNEIVFNQRYLNDPDFDEEEMENGIHFVYFTDEENTLPRHEADGLALISYFIFGSSEWRTFPQFQSRNTRVASEHAKGKNLARHNRIPSEIREGYRELKGEIKSGKKHREFQNREGKLPDAKPGTHYVEHAVGGTDGPNPAGQHRIVALVDQNTGSIRKKYYTLTHYGTGDSSTPKKADFNAF